MDHFAMRNFCKAVCMACCCCAHFGHVCSADVPEI